MNRLRERKLEAFIEARRRRGICYGWMGGEAAAPSPDYSGAAKEQAASSKELTTQQTWANRPNQYTPWGSTNWSSNKQVDPATGQEVTGWTQEQRLNPQSQAALDDQMRIQSDRSNLAGGFMQRVGESYAQPFDWTNLPSMAGTPQAQMTGTYGVDTSAPGQTTGTTNEPAFAQERQRLEQGMFDKMRPEHQFQENASRTQLANQGLTPGSSAYNRELQRLHEQQAGERFNATQVAGQEQQRMNQQVLAQQQQAYGQDVGSQQAQNAAYQQAYGQELGSNAQNYNQMQQMADYQNRLRQQGIAEQAQQRGMSLNEMNALLTGQQVGTPSMPSFNTAAAAQPVQALGAATAQGNYNIAAGQQQQQADSAMWGGLGSMAGAAAMFSDERLKSDVVRVGTHPLGVGVYEYTIFDRRERGVMAQELLTVAPHLVGIGPGGYLMVDYGGL